tara:strand:- start:54 stop:557 length:504 start_codon:yes stop_codon:yes gene_type:complete
MSELNNQFSYFINLVFEKILIFGMILNNYYESVILNIDIKSDFNSIWSQITKYINDISLAIFRILEIELTDIKIISNSIYNSLSANGKISVSILILFLIVFFFIIFSRPKKNKQKKASPKSKSKRTLLLEIEIDLLELEDKYNRKVISLNSYLSEAKRLQEKADEIV